MELGIAKGKELLLFAPTFRGIGPGVDQLIASFFDPPSRVAFSQSPETELGPITTTFAELSENIAAFAGGYDGSAGLRHPLSSAARERNLHRINHVTRPR